MAASGDACQAAGDRLNLDSPSVSSCRDRVPMTSADPIANLAALIRCPSVTPAEGGALTALAAMLEPLGFTVERMVASEPDMPDIENLYARIGTEGPHLMFAGHTDVVPVGDAAAWTHDPFSAEIGRASCRERV